MRFAVILKVVLIALFLNASVKSVFSKNVSDDTIIPSEILFSARGVAYDLLVPSSANYINNNTNLSSLRNNENLNKIRMSLRSNGCTCQELICGCCLDFNIAQFNFQRTGCMNLTVDPRQFAVTFNMLWDDNVLLENVLSGKNPPPVCVPLPIPYIPSLDACIRIFDASVLVEEQRVHACLDVDIRLQRAPILVLHFDCVQVGSDTSVSLVKPTLKSLLLE